jgi:hypothetical protein
LTEGLATGVPDLSWIIQELLVSGEDRIVVRGEATGTPIGAFLGATPATAALRQLARD